MKPYHPGAEMSINEEKQSTAIEEASIKRNMEDSLNWDTPANKANQEREMWLESFESNWDD